MYTTQEVLVMRYFDFTNDGYNVRDVVRAVVTVRCGKGMFLTLENGEEAYAKGGLCPGTKVLCSILKKPTAEYKMLVSIDSVMYNDYAA